MLSQTRKQWFTEDSPGRVVALAALLVLMVLVVYWPAMQGGFICDDISDVQTNTALSSWHGLWAIWAQPGTNAQYYPLTFTSFWLNYQAGGLNPIGYHLINVILHAANTLLVWRLLRVMRIPAAWFGAALFALHPVNVESVAYIDERKNVLSGFFFLCSLLAAIKFWLPDVGCKRDLDESVANPFGSWKFYGLTFVLYLLALLSKTATLPLPAVILLLIWWKRRPTLHDVTLLAPLALVGVALGLVTMHLESHLTQTMNPSTLSWLERCLLASRDVWFYLGKLIWPHPLIFSYPRWSIRASDWIAYLPLAALAIAVCVLWRYRLIWGRAGLFALAYFVALLFLMLGFFNIYYFRYSFVADHFQYLAGIGPLALAAAASAAAGNWLRERFPVWLPRIASTALFSLLGTLSWQQAATYQTPETLWQVTLNRNPECAMAAVNLGQCLYQKGRINEAADLYRRALKLNPDIYEAVYNLAEVMHQSGQYADSIAIYERALKSDPDKPGVLNNLAWLLATCPEAKLRDGHRAVILATRACELKHYEEPTFIGTLAAANAEADQFFSAMGYAKIAIHTADQQGLIEVAKRNKQLLTQYYNFGKPYHEPTPGNTKQIR